MTPSSIHFPHFQNLNPPKCVGNPIHSSPFLSYQHSILSYHHVFASNTGMPPSWSPHSHFYLPPIAPFSSARAILPSFDIMHLIMPLLCLKSYNGFSSALRIKIKQTFHISYKARQAALISSHTTLHFKLQPCQCWFICWDLHAPRPSHTLPSPSRESTCHPPQSLHLIQTPFILPISSLPSGLGFSSLLFSLVMPQAAPP